MCGRTEDADNFYNQTIWHQYINAILMACTIITFLWTLTNYTRVLYSRHITRNRLTTIPYVFIMIFLTLLGAQIVWKEFFPDCGNDWILILRNIETIKSTLCLLIVSSQMFEWIDQYVMVGFQASMDISELSVRKNEFNDKERALARIYVTIYIIAFLTTVFLYDLVYLS